MLAKPNLPNELKNENSALFLNPLKTPALINTTTQQGSARAAQNK